MFVHYILINVFGINNLLISKFIANQIGNKKNRNVQIQFSCYNSRAEFVKLFLKNYI